jgi:hypothetical protein
MSQLLIDKIKRSRETQVMASGFIFTVRRPTDLEVSVLSGKELKQGDLLEKFVSGWDLKELDIIPGGDGAFVPFSTPLFMEWVADHPEIWGPLASAIVASYESHQIKMAETLGKQKAG